MGYLLRSAHNLKQRFHLCTNVYYPLVIPSRNKTVIMKYLNVAEKNDAAKNIALHLSRGQSRRREGLSTYNKIYEFETEVNGQMSQMVMTSVSGHLLALEFVGAYKNWQSCNPLSLFDAPVFKYCPDHYEKIKKTLEREVRGCHGLIIWTDCDREGENIGFEIIQVCTAMNSNLRILRAKFSEITTVSVQRALRTLEPPNKNISDAVDVRQELDLRIGAAFTRFQTLRLQKVFPSKLADSLVSYGSCQFPTLGFVVERYRAVENFVAESFWKIKVNHTINNLDVDFLWERVRLFDRDACQVLFDICLDDPIAKVVDVKTKPKSKWRPLPLDTVELEKIASRKLKISAKETMKIAEKLYTQGLISYPRTETNEFPKEMNLTQLVGLQTGDRNWGEFAQRILDSGGPTPRQGNKSDKAHPPIHPTKYTNSLSGNEDRLYKFIVRSFLACCSKDAQGKETTVTTVIANEKFTANGLMITERNYLDVYPYDKWSSKEIHVYENGQTFMPTNINMVDGTTSPPNLLTEADLIALMEKHGIGTDATHAEHIETIKSRSYVALADQIHFVPGLLGMGLVEGYDAMGLHISKPHLRAQLEADLKAISEGRKQPAQVLAEQIAAYKEVYVTVSAEAEKIDAALGERFSERPNEYVPTIETMPAEMPKVLKCPKCDSDMTLRQKKNNSDESFISCVSYPNCKNAVWFPSIVRTVEVLTETCPNCGPNYKKVKFEWRNNSISHLYPPPYIACIGGCDMTLLEMLKINLSSVRTVSENSRTQHSNTNRANVTHNSNSIVNRPNITQSSNANVRPNMRQNLNTGPTVGSGCSAQVIPAPATMPAPANTDSADDKNIMCRCNKPAILLTVRKQNANFGKKFYKCLDGRDRGGCEFFLWTSESAETSTQSQYGPPPPNNSWGSYPQMANNNQNTRAVSSSSRNSNADDLSPDVIPECHCGLPSKRLTVFKEGPNKGRKFFNCQGPNSCNYFKWADGSPSSRAATSSTSTRSRGRGRGRGAARGTGRGVGGGRRCGACGQTGHVRTRCPNNAP